LASSDADPLIRALANYKERMKRLGQLATDVGHVPIARASLHDTLGKFFTMLFNPVGLSVICEDAAVAAWGAVKSDHSQRKMLEAAAKAELSNDSLARTELLWALGQINKLENDRNNALHASYSAEFDDGTFKVVPS